MAADTCCLATADIGARPSTLPSACVVRRPYESTMRFATMSCVCSTHHALRTLNSFLSLLQRISLALSPLLLLHALPGPQLLFLLLALPEPFSLLLLAPPALSSLPLAPPALSSLPLAPPALSSLLLALPALCSASSRSFFSSASLSSSISFLLLLACSCFLSALNSVLCLTRHLPCLTSSRPGGLSSVVSSLLLASFSQSAHFSSLFFCVQTSQSNTTSSSFSLHRPHCLPIVSLRTSFSSSSFCFISTNFLWVCHGLWVSSFFRHSSSLLCSPFGPVPPSLSPSSLAVSRCAQILLLCLDVHPFLRYPFLCLSWSHPPDTSHLPLGRGLHFLCLSVLPPIYPSPPARLCFPLAPVPHRQDPLACLACFIPVLGAVLAFLAAVALPLAAAFLFFLLLPPI